MSILPVVSGVFSVCLVFPCTLYPVPTGLCPGQCGIRSIILRTIDRPMLVSSGFRNQ